MRKVQEVLKNILESIKLDVDSKGNSKKWSVNQLNLAYRPTFQALTDEIGKSKTPLSDEIMQDFVTMVREASLIKGERGSSQDTQEIKSLRVNFQTWLETQFKLGLVVLDNEHKALTQKERYVAINKNEDRIAPQFMLANVDDRIRKAKEKEAQAIKKS